MGDWQPKTDSDVLKLATATGPMIAGVIDAIRYVADNNPTVAMDLMLIMQRAEAVEKNVHGIQAMLRSTSPNPVDYIGETIMKEGMANGILHWVVVDWDNEDNKCEIEKVAHVPGKDAEVISREWMPFEEVRKWLAAWRYPETESVPA